MRSKAWRQLIPPLLSRVIAISSVGAQTPRAPVRNRQCLVVEGIPQRLVRINVAMKDVSLRPGILSSSARFMRAVVTLRADQYGVVLRVKPSQQRRKIVLRHCGTARGYGGAISPHVKKNASPSTAQSAGSWSESSAGAGCVFPRELIRLGGAPGAGKGTNSDFIRKGARHLLRHLLGAKNRAIRLGRVNGRRREEDQLHSDELDP